MTSNQTNPKNETGRAATHFGIPPKIGWGRLAGIIAVLATPLLIGAGRLDSTERDTHRQHIEEMTQAQRNQLSHNFRLFKRLATTDPETLTVYRDIQAAVDQDDELLKVANAYHGWLRTLSLTERQRLENEKDPRKRIALIGDIQAERAKSTEQQKRQSIPDRVVPAIARQHFSAQDRLSDEDLAAIMKIAEDHLSLQPAQRGKLEKLEGARRYAQIIGILVKNSNESNTPLQAIWSESDTELIDEMVNSISNENQREKLQKLGLLPKMQQVLVRMVLRSVIAEVREEIRDEVHDNPPRHADLRQLFFNLDDAERDRIMQMPKRQQRMALVHKYYSRQYPMSELKTIMKRFVSRDNQIRNNRPRQFPENRQRPFRNQDRPGNRRGADRGNFED